MARIFISYSRTDEAFARRLAATLSQLGADIWIDIEDIPAGMKWSRAIQEGLDLAELLMLIVSPDSMTSQNVEDEWQYYLDQKKPVIPILWKPARTHFQLNRIQHIDFHAQEYDSALRDLHSELARKGVHLNPLPDVRPTLEVSAPRRRKSNPALALGLVGGAVGVLALVALVVALLVLAPRPTGTTSPTTDGNLTSPPATDLPAVSTATQISVPIGFAGNPVTHNQDWTQTILRNLDGIDMKLVPAGCFTMGSTEAQIDAALTLCQPVLPGCIRGQFEDEAPQTQVCFEQPFWIGHYEVTNAEYGSSGAFPGDNLPRTNVTWNEAQAFCESRRGRLPTEAEWEYAARGPDGLIFPWGNEFDPQPLNYCDGTCSIDQGWKDNAHNDGYPDPAPVGSYANASWVGAFDLSGNVWEWTSTIYRPYPYDAHDGRENLADSDSKRVLRGSSWNWIAADARTPARDDSAGDLESSDWYGFRCARDFQPGDLD